MHRHPFHEAHSEKQRSVLGDILKKWNQSNRDSTIIDAMPKVDEAGSDRVPVLYPISSIILYCRLVQLIRINRHNSVTIQSLVCRRRVLSTSIT